MAVTHQVYHSVQEQSSCHATSKQRATIPCRGWWPPSMYAALRSYSRLDLVIPLVRMDRLLDTLKNCGAQYVRDDPLVARLHRVGVDDDAVRHGARAVWLEEEDARIALLHRQHEFVRAHTALRGESQFG